jgi:hypothetical protein
MPTRSAWVKMGGGASVVGLLLVILWAILKFAVQAKIGNLDLLVGVGAVLVVGGLAGGVVVSRSDPNI